MQNFSTKMLPRRAASFPYETSFVRQEARRVRVRVRVKCLSRLLFQGKSLEADDRHNIKQHDLHFDGFWLRPELASLPGVQALGYGDVVPRVVVAVGCGTGEADVRRSKAIMDNVGSIAELQFANTGIVTPYAIPTLSHAIPTLSLA